MLEWHQLFQINSQHTEEDGISEGAKEVRKIQRLDGQTRIDEEVHHDRITDHGCHTYREQAGVFLVKNLAPKQTEKATDNGAYPFHKVEHIRSEGAEMQHTARESRLQHLRCTAHELHEGEEDEQRDEPLILPCRQFDVRVSDVKHSLDAEISRYDEKQYIHLHHLRVEPVVMLAVIEEENEFQHPCRPQDAT